MLARLAALITRYDWLLLLLLLPVVLFPAPGRALLWLLMPLLLVARRIATGRFLPATPLNLSLLLLATMILVSTWATPDLSFSIGKVIGLTHGILLFFAVADAARRGSIQRRRAVGLFLLGGLGVAALGLLGTQWTQKLPVLSELVNRLPRQVVALPGSAVGGFSPNQVAGVLLWIAPPALALAVGAVRRHGAAPTDWLSWSAPPAALVLTGTLLLTQSRAGLLGLAAGVGVMLLLALTGRWRRLLFLGGTLLLLGGLLAVWQSTALQVAMAEPLGFGRGTDVYTLEGRLEIWSRALYGLQDFPLTGMGMNSFRRVVHVLYPLFIIAPTEDIAHAHNQWLQAGLDLGLPGLVAYLAAWLGVLGVLARRLRRHTAPLDRLLAIGIFGALAASFVYGLFDAVALGARPGFLFWILLGLAVSLPEAAGRLPNEQAAE